MAIERNIHPPNNLTLEPRIVVNVDDTERASRETRPDQLAVLARIDLVQLSIRRGHGTQRDIGCRSSIQAVAVDQELPSDGQPEGVEAILLDKMLHLRRAVAVPFAQRDHQPEAVPDVLFPLDVAAELEASYVDALGLVRRVHVVDTRPV